MVAQSALQVGLAFDEDFEETALLARILSFHNFAALFGIFSMRLQAVTLRRPRPEPKLPREPG